MGAMYSCSQEQSETLPQDGTTFLTIPVEILTPEEKQKQSEFLGKQNDEKDAGSPTKSERIWVMEVTFWTLFLKLAKEEFSYSFLLEAVKNGESEKVLKIMQRNTLFFDSVKQDTKTDLGVRKSLGWLGGPPTYYFEGTVNISLQSEEQRITVIAPGAEQGRGEGTNPGNKREPSRSIGHETFLQVPKEILTPEDIRKQRDYLKNDEVQSGCFKKSSLSIDETTWTLEVVFWTVLYKLANRTVPYKILKEFMENGGCENLRKIFDHNSKVLEAFKQENRANFDFEKNSKLSSMVSLKAEVNIILKIDDEQPSEVATDRAGSNQPDTGCLIRESELNVHSELDNGQTKKVDTEEPSSNQLSTGCSEEEPADQEDVELEDGVVQGKQHGVNGEGAMNTLEVLREFEQVKKEELEHTQTPVKPENSVVTSHDQKVDEILRNVKKSKLKASKERSDEESDKKARKDLKEYENYMQKLCEKDKKLNEEIMEKTKKEMKTALENHEKMMKELSKIAKENEEINRKMEKEKSEQEELKFQREIEDMWQKHDEKMKKIREEREEIEKEAERERLQFLADFHARTNAFLKCLLLKMKWEEQEKDWVDFLGKLKHSIAKVKIQFLRFPMSMNNLDKKDIEREVCYLLRSAEAAHVLLYRAFFYLKKLSEQVPDKIFVRILMKNVQNSSDKILMVLKNVGKTEANKHTHEILRGILDTVDTSDIMSTWKLREIAKTAEFKDYENIEDPMKLEDVEETTRADIVELPDDSESLSQEIRDSVEPRDHETEITEPHIEKKKGLENSEDHRREKQQREETIV